ncbi:hypothetical protein GCM10018954_028160 [Kutzneria kofuensis]
MVTGSVASGTPGRGPLAPEFTGMPPAEPGSSWPSGPADPATFAEQLVSSAIAAASAKTVDPRRRPAVLILVLPLAALCYAASTLLA